ncbi:Ted2 [Forsythia ovata]|uniref:Ted2 n=1 Tax=Forsythia ovata TaxID=205694 RepID=A0ABD1X9B3_9LAMI
MVSFGQSSGTPDPVPLSALAVKSLFLTRPSMMHYTVTRGELLKTAGELFANVESGVLKAHVNHKYPLSQAAQAHADLESRKTSGSFQQQVAFTKSRLLAAAHDTLMGKNLTIMVEYHENSPQALVQGYPEEYAKRRLQGLVMGHL